MKHVHAAAAHRKTALVPVDRIERAIFVVRHERVMADCDLADLYGVTTRALIQAVKRNAARFPPDFMFQMTADELAALRSQIVISNGSRGQGGRRYPPHVFTEQGVAMLSGILRSERAVKVNVEIIRTFVRLRRLLAAHPDLARRLLELEQKCDRKFTVVFEALRGLLSPRAEGARRRIGFRPALPGGSSHEGRARLPPPATRAATAPPVSSPRAPAACASTPPASRTARRR